MDEVRRVFASSGLRVIGVSETWLKSSTSNKAVEIDGYKLLRNDRPVKRGGGVAMYVRQGLHSKITSKSKDTSSEYLFVKIVYKNTKALIGVIYRPPM